MADQPLEQGSPEWWANVAKVAEETASPDGSLWWLSFADPTLPAGTQFLGACLVEANSLVDAISVSHLRGINPGGEVATWGPFPPDKAPHYPRHELLSRERITELDEANG